MAQAQAVRMDQPFLVETFVQLTAVLELLAFHPRGDGAILVYLYQCQSGIHIEVILIQ